MDYSLYVFLHIIYNKKTLFHEKARKSFNSLIFGHTQGIIPLGHGPIDSFGLLPWFPHGGGGDR